MKKLLIAGICFSLMGCATGPHPDTLLTADDLRQKVTYTNDALDGYKYADSSDFRKPYYGGGYPIKSSKVFTRVYLRDNDRVDAQIYFWTKSSEWVYPYSLNFGEPLRTRTAERIDSDVQSCSGSSCTLLEQVVINLTEDDIKYIVNDAPDWMDIRLKTKFGVDVDRTLRPEFLTLPLERLGVLDRYKTN